MPIVNWLSWRGTLEVIQSNLLLKAVQSRFEYLQGQAPSEQLPQCLTRPSSWWCLVGIYFTSHPVSWVAQLFMRATWVCSIFFFNTMKKRRKETLLHWNCSNVESVVRRVSCSSILITCQILRGFTLKKYTGTGHKFYSENGKQHG